LMGVGRFIKLEIFGFILVITQIMVYLILLYVTQ
jgi:hypothetical protein